MIRILSTLVLMLFLFAGVHSASAAKRVALVIGNSAYEHAPELINPKNDAADMSAKLKALDFEVTEGIDVNLQDLLAKIQDFANRLEDADVAAFYYAGHGLQVKGQNYLVPVDAKLKSHITLDYEAVPIDLVLASMQERAETNLLFLDACRDNPLARSLARSMGTRSSAIGQGLARIGSGRGTLVAFATEPGNVALDGTGENSPYTKALVKHLGTPGESLSDSMIRVRREVMQTTNGSQVPWEHSSLTGRVVLKEKSVEPPKPDKSPEIAYWNSIKDHEDRNFFEAYLEQFPNGIFAGLAKLKIKTIEKRLAQEQQAIKAAKAAAERKAVEEAKKSEEQRLAQIEAEQAKQVLEARKAEEQRLASIEAERTQQEAEARKAEEQRVAEERRLADIAARKEAQRLSAETVAKLKAAEESRKAAEAGRLAAEKRLAELDAARKQREGDEAQQKEHLAAAAKNTADQKELQIATLEQPITEPITEAVKTDPIDDRELTGMRLDTNEKQDDSAKEVELLKYAAEAGDPEAQFKLSRFFERGDGVERDIERAIELLTRAANAGFPEAINDLGFLHFQGSMGNPRDPEKAIELFARAAELRHPQAMFNYAALIDDGIVPNKTSEDSAFFLYEALRSGNKEVLDQLSGNPRMFKASTRSALQRKLYEHDFYKGAIDGQFGPQTIKGLRKAFGLPE